MLTVTTSRGALLGTHATVEKTNFVEQKPIVTEQRTRALHVASARLGMKIHDSKQRGGNLLWQIALMVFFPQPSHALGIEDDSDRGEQRRRPIPT